jgi:hypothetical protein
MTRLLTLLAVLLLAQSVDDPQSRPDIQAPSGVHVDRHVDAHVAPREGAPAASPGEPPSRESWPAPAVGTTGKTATPPIQFYRDPAFRDRRF